jgi:hypothetical protein
MDHVYRLVHDVYVERGYCDPQPDGRLRHYRYLDDIPESTVLVALSGGEIVGTCTLTFDGPRGLNVDEDFKEEADALRREGGLLCSVWRIATSPRCRGGPRVVLALITETIRLGVESGVTQCLIVCTPRHERIYRRLIRTQPLRVKSELRGIRNTAAALVRVDVEATAALVLGHVPAAQAMGA